MTKDLQHTIVIFRGSEGSSKELDELDTGDNYILHSRGSN